MQVEMGKFLNSINSDEEVLNAFSNAKLIEAKINNKAEKFKILIEIPEILDIKIYQKFNDSLKKFPYKCNVTFKVANHDSINEVAVNVYYKQFINEHLQGLPIFEALIKLKPILVGQQIIIYVSSKILQESISSFSEVLRTSFKNAGFYQPVVLELKQPDEEEVERIIEEERQRLIKSSLELEKQKNIVVDSNKKNTSFYKERNNNVIEVDLSSIKDDDSNVAFSARIFKIDVRQLRRGNLYLIYVTDDKDSILIKLRENANFTNEFLSSLQEEMHIRATGKVIYDQFEHDSVFDPRKIEILDVNDERIDEEIEKRVELHLHTNMSTLDGVCNIEKYVKRAIKYGHKALAVTDHGVVQAYPDAQNAIKGTDLKIIYGMEGYIVNEKLPMTINDANIKLDDAVFTVIDIETTGLSNRYDDIIEIGAVKIKNGLEIDSFHSFINPKKRLSSITKEITGITDEMLIGAPLFEDIATNLRKFLQNTIFVAHNASFDFEFINEFFKKHTKEGIYNPVIDTLSLARSIYPHLKSYSLGSVSRSLNVAYLEDEAHRADYDARVLSEVFERMRPKIINELHVLFHNQLGSLSPENAWSKTYPTHMIFLVKNTTGLKNLYNLVSLSHTKYFSGVPRIPRGIIEKYREGLLIGSACFNGEIFEIAANQSKEKLIEAIKFYDFIEIQHLDNYSYLIDSKSIEGYEKLKTVLTNLVEEAQNLNKIVVATGDCHYLDPKDKIYRDVYIVAKAKEARRHPLYDYRNPTRENPNQHFRTTKEMLEGVSFLGDKLAHEIVVTNTNKIADMIDTILPVQDQLYTPTLPNIDAQKEIEKLCYDNAKRIYGDPIPSIVLERLEKELGKIRDNKFGVIYYLAYRLVEKSKNDGYLVGSRGSVGSSLVATLSGITEVNPLPPHYLCPECKHSEFFSDGSIKSGYDLDDKICPLCGHMMSGEGHNIPFETFLGINGDKVPDIDLNFSGDYQWQAHNYTKELLGEDNVFRAGTISTVAEKTAFGFARNYYFDELKRERVRNAELARLAHYCEGVKRTTGQHPGGIIVIPLDKDVHDFTPVQYPADDLTASWKTTHFKFEAIHEEILKLDILGHDDPTALRMLKDLTGINPVTLPLNDHKVLSLFTSTEALKVKPDDIYSNTGVSGIPEFGTIITKRILEDAKPHKFSELVQISGLAHGTNVWKGNAQDLIKSGVGTIMDVIGCRDDVMTYLVEKGLPAIDAFKIMENVRKKERQITSQQENLMRNNNVPEWYIDSAKKIQYMFPKAHAVAYVCMALRVAWYKVYRPLEYYATYFSVRCQSYDLESMMMTHKELKERLHRLYENINDRSIDSQIRNKEKDLEDVILMSLEMVARGYKFSNISLEKSEAKRFAIDYDNNALIPPFVTVAGLGEAVAESIIKARADQPFLSKQDFITRTSINTTQLKYLEKKGVLDFLDEEDQLTLKLF